MTLIASMGVMFSACQHQVGTTSVNYQGTDPSARVPYNKDEVAKIRTSLAAQYIRERKLDAASNQLQMVFETNQHYAPAYDMMGVLLQTEGSAINLAKADHYYRQAMALDPSFMQAYNNYGVYLSLMGKYRQALTYFSKAGSTLGYDGRAGAIENLGTTYKKLGDIKRAKEAFIRALEANSSSVLARAELIDILLAEGNSLIAKQLYDELNSLLGDDGLSASMLLQGIKIAVVQGNHTQQQTLSQKLLATYPLSDEARRLKVWLTDTKKPLQ